jgi:hypothetical protein
MALLPGKEGAPLGTLPSDVEVRLPFEATESYCAEAARSGEPRLNRIEASRVGCQSTDELAKAYYTKTDLWSQTTCTQLNVAKTCAIAQRNLPTSAN